MKAGDLLRGQCKRGGKEGKKRQEVVPLLTTEARVLTPERIPKRALRGILGDHQEEVSAD